MKGIIYLITFPNNKYYVGQTYRGLEIRKKGHKQAMKKSNCPVYRAMRKYGWDNLKWEIIDTATSVSELDKKEMYWIKYYKSYVGFKDHNGYNANLGGNRGISFGPLNEEELKKFGEDYRAGMSKDELQKKYNIEHRWTLNSICAGRQWNEFTGIPRKDYSIYPKNAKLSDKEVDDIIDKFQEIGRCEIIAKEFGVRTRVVTEIVKGKKWSEYTGINDDSFYEKYHQQSTLLSNEELLFIASERLNEGDFEDIVIRFSNIKRDTLKAIWNGHMLNNFTKIPLKTEKEKIEKPGHTKLKTKTVDEILKLHKEGKTGVEIAKQLNLNNSLVHNILSGRSWSKYTGIKYETSNRRKLTKEEIKLIYELTNNGHSIKEISEQFDICYDSVYRIKNKRIYKNILK